jgi:hypothetical protein
MKILKRLLHSAIIILVFAQLVNAQAVSTSKFGWDQPAVQLTDAQGFSYKYYPDGATTGIALTGVTCSGTASPFQCQVAIPAFTPGNHTVTFTATNIAGESAKSTPLNFVFVVTPGAPTNPKIIQ